MPKGGRHRTTPGARLGATSAPTVILVEQIQAAIAQADTKLRQLQTATAECKAAETAATQASAAATDVVQILDHAIEQLTRVLNADDLKTVVAALHHAAHNATSANVRSGNAHDHNKQPRGGEPAPIFRRALPV